MKNYFAIAIMFLAFTSCEKKITKGEALITKTESKVSSNTDLANSTRIYPENLSKIFNAHGSIEQWNRLGNLVFEIEKPEGNEKTTTALKTRASLIETKTYTLGNNGEFTWLEEREEKAFKGNPKFYYNLMFYFYAMPFVLADDGISYENVEPLIFEGKQYPGIKVSYKAGTGESPEDEYILYYDEITNKMAWLGYTVTYFSKEKSKDFHFVKYDEWQTVNGFVLPSKLVWYKADGFKIGEKKREARFVNVSVSKSAPKSTIFEKTKAGEVIE